MTNRLGTKLETEIANWLKDHGWPYAHRRERKGAKDEGDVCLSERVPFTIEAKSAAKTTDRMHTGAWLNELEEEVRNVGDEAGAVVHKRRGTTDVGEYVVLMPMKYLNLLLTRTYEAGQKDQRKVARRNRVIPPFDGD